MTGLHVDSIDIGSVYVEEMEFYKYVLASRSSL